ncbi:MULTISPECIES: isoamylase early set domain-containing protein [Thermomonospora]|uniref:Glycoside hydrolase family 13 domain protein n=1 Tax=Thermomonospora curvata (strain ATCC 19995 / DSM 43183 / JCM 3096 / KCTC 9072 / NBRC 15933 / NCIMB 10081 / Henssen B9) TaxID=471852 RepID=D1A1G2_THECD|nr:MULTISPECIES: isoamylase early set domain-containing protein [Thermomonospora]ACY95884.1 glycoside hydrolase family 13 domain protein [Thermomonospora curvata DSM 43183]PKK16130.1 MAG: glycoside hydrolase family 13 [Thermomonospora sp. CIF 1]
MLRRSRLFGRKTRVTFSLPADEPPGTVSVVGDFNDWEPGRHELVKRRNGTRSVSVTLAPGTYRFRYLGTGGLWFDDDTADAIDSQGSVITIG